MTFADLHRSLTPPTAADVAQAIRDELAALAVEFAVKTPGAWPADRDAARRLSLDVALAMHDGPFDRDTRDVLTLLRRGEAETARAVHGYDRDLEIDTVAEALTAKAEKIAAEWRSNMRDVA